MNNPNREPSSLPELRAACEEASAEVIRCAVDFVGAAERPDTDEEIREAGAVLRVCVAHLRQMRARVRSAEALRDAN